MPGSVLLVEDEENLAALVEAYLVQEGYRVAAVGSGAAALELLERDSVRLIVLDLNLPDLDGLDLCRQIRMRSACITWAFERSSREVWSAPRFFSSEQRQ